MMNRMEYSKHIFLYLFFGVCTTIINWGSYYICFNFAKISNVCSNIIAWVLAVAFAFITNKIWVFGSKSKDKKTLMHEVWTFTAARLGTGFLDLIIMYFAVDVFSMNAGFWKLIANILVILLNYVFSKTFVFIKK